MGNKSKNIIFRVDASIEMGSGHVMRCLTLADALVSNGAKCYFICREHSGHMLKMIESRGYSVSLLPTPDVKRTLLTAENQLEHAAWLGNSMQEDAAQTITAIDNLNLNGMPEWCVIDHYAIDSRWEDTLKPYYRKLMVIDDLADRKHSCDVLLDQTYGRDETDYSSYVSAKCKLLIGSKFALLRPDFFEWRQFSLDRRTPSKLEHLLITMGGIDENNITSDILLAIKDCTFPENFHITVVMGGHAPWLKEVMGLSRSLPLNIEVKVDVSNMAQLMSESDLCIGAAGSTTWERCCLGLPSLMIVLASNQALIAKKLEKDEMVDLLSHPSELSGIINSYYSDLDRLTKLTISSSSIVDGLGVQRVISNLDEISNKDV